MALTDREMGLMTEATSEFDAAMAEVQRRVEDGRRNGTYPEELDEQMASEFSRMAKDPLWFGSFDALPAAVERVRSAGFGRAVIATTSSIPGGSALHRIIGKVVSRQMLGVAQQMSAFAADVTSSLEALVAALEETRTVIRGDVLGDIDAVHHRLVGVERRLARLEAAASADDAHGADAGDAAPAGDSTTDASAAAR